MMQNNIHCCDSDTAADSSSASGRSEMSGSWDVIPPLQNVSVGTSFHTLIEQQTKQIEFLTDQLSDFNRVRYRTLPVNSSRGKNVIRTAKKVSMTTMDQINQQTVASYLREAVWPTYKKLPKNWSKWRDDKKSLCQMILNKVAVLVGVNPKSYWEAMLLGITNDKYCSLRSIFKQEMFEQFQGKLCNKIHVTYLFMLTSLW
jgi:hypothetical protein